MAKNKPSFPNRPCPKCGKPIHIKSKKHEQCGWSADNGAISAQAKSAVQSAGDGGETVAGYFRKLFKENPKLLGERSNETLLKRWLADHPGHAEVPGNVKANLSNLKSVLRSKKRKKVARRAEAMPNGQVSQPAAPVARKVTGSSKLEALEFQIDECLTMARQTDREGLHDVIGLLRRARNAVVWKIGQ